MEESEKNIKLSLLELKQGSMSRQIPPFGSQSSLFKNRRHVFHKVTSRSLVSLMNDRMIIDIPDAQRLSQGMGRYQERSELSP
jgi:hypothetical protein